MRTMSYWQLSQGTAFDLRSKSAIRSLEPSVVFFAFAYHAIAILKAPEVVLRGRQGKLLYTCIDFIACTPVELLFIK